MALRLFLGRIADADGSYAFHIVDNRRHAFHGNVAEYNEPRTSVGNYGGDTEEWISTGRPLYVFTCLANWMKRRLDENGNPLVIEFVCDVMTISDEFKLDLTTALCGFVTPDGIPSEKLPPESFIFVDTNTLLWLFQTEVRDIPIKRLIDETNEEHPNMPMSVRDAYLAKREFREYMSILDEMRNGKWGDDDE